MLSAEASRPEPAFAPVWTNSRWLACAALLWLGCTATYFLTAPGRIDIIDGAIRYDVTESLLERGAPVVRNQYYFAVPGRDGRRYAFYQLGASVTALPFVMLGERLGNGSLESKQFAFSLTSVPFAAGIISLLFLIYGRLGCSLPQAVTWSLVVAFCTILWPYAGSSFDVVLQAFWLTLAVWASIEAMDGKSYRWAVLSAGAFAMLINIQEMYLVLGACVLTGSSLTYRTVWNRLKLPTVHVIFLGMFVGLVLVLAYNTLRFGNPSMTGRGSVPHPLLGNPLVGFAGLTISPAKSVFLYSPPLVLALLGLRRLMSRVPDRFAPVVACLILHVGLISFLKFWAGEWAWGPRYLVASLPLACIGLPYGWSSRKRPWRVSLMCGAGFVVQLLAVSVDHQRYYVERGLEPFFWMDESTMYTDSPLAARPAELIAVLEGRGREHVRALVPGPRPISMTSTIFGPPLFLVSDTREWMHRYLVFLVPRPWTLWSRFLPDAQRPGPTSAMAVSGSAIAMASFGALAGLIQLRRKTNR